jgi:methionine-rich copper-binding protein CopC
MKKLIAIVLALLVLIPGAQAFAHAQLVGAFPKANAKVSQAVSQVKLTFDDNLIVLGDSNQITVTNSKKQRVDNEKSVVVGNQLSVGLKKLKIGKYKVSYRALSADGHPISATYSFWVTK